MQWDSYRTKSVHTKGWLNSTCILANRGTEGSRPPPPPPLPWVFTDVIATQILSGLFENGRQFRYQKRGTHLRASYETLDFQYISSEHFPIGVGSKHLNVMRYGTAYRERSMRGCGVIGAAFGPVQRVQRRCRQLWVISIDGGCT